MVDGSAVVIGQVKIGNDVSIWPHAVIRGDVNQIIIGARTNIQDGCVLHVSRPRPHLDNLLIVGEDVTIAHRVVLHSCNIGNRVLIGMGTIILDGAVIEDNVMVGVGSVVTSNKLLKSGYLYLGSPAKMVRKLTDEELENLKNSALVYVNIKNQYLAQSNTI